MKYEAEMVAIAYLPRISTLCSMRIETAILAPHRSSKRGDLLVPVWLDVCMSSCKSPWDCLSVEVLAEVLPLVKQVLTLVYLVHLVNCEEGVGAAVAVFHGLVYGVVQA